ncbi:DsbA family protein [Limosilactobacillus frumenti]|nr:DsbA family protein [Limosilactobacillus frumenti]MBA2914037.1 DsbA family protein [Limosilactobacillus frumenti]QFG72380.1 DsbA family protein [Limosilactobacillus frumenti]
MLEIHLFVNPLGIRCFRCENDVLKMDQQLNTQIRYRFIPLFNMNTIQQTIQLYHLNQHSLITRQQVVSILNQVIMDYMAASFQGRKRGRRYLLLLQNELICQNHKYNLALVKTVAQSAGLDLEMFLEDRHSDLAKEAHQKDQQIAAELGVTRTASAVVFDSNDQNEGVLINDFDYESLISAMHNNYLDDEQSPQQFAKHYHHSLLKIVQK